MNNRLLTLIIAMLTLMMTACSQDEPVVQAQEGQRCILSFEYSEPQSRVSLHGSTTGELDDNEQVCAVIAQKNVDGTFQYKAYSIWHYHAENKMLLLDQIEYTENYQTVLGPWSNANNQLLRRFVPTGKVEEDGYVELCDANVNYAFFWHYPVVDEAEARAQFNAGNLMYPNALDSIPNGTFDDVMMAKRPTVDKVNDWTIYDPPHWRQHPVWVNWDQRSNERFTLSHHLWARNIVRKEGGDFLASEIIKCQPVVFRHVGAVLQVVFDAHPDSVYFSSQSGVNRGMQIDLGTGSQIDYTPYVQQWPPMPEASKYYLYKGKWYPHPTDVTGNTLRLILPPQKLDDFTLNFKLNGSSHSIHLSDELPRLEANGLYIIRITRSGGHDLIINDWEIGDSQVIHPVQ